MESGFAASRRSLSFAPSLCPKDKSAGGIIIFLFNGNKACSSVPSGRILLNKKHTRGFGHAERQIHTLDRRTRSALAQIIVAGGQHESVVVPLH